MTDNDTLRRFLFEHLGIRGELVRLSASWQALHQDHHYPDTVLSELGQAIAASILLSATIKYDGSLILQMEGSGPLTMLVAQATSQRTFRGLAHWNDTVEPGDLHAIHGEGRLVITLQPSGAGDRYQGIVPLTGADLAGALGAYFQQSEQLDTGLWLAANASQATGLLLQKLPDRQSDDADAWNRIAQLAATLTDSEMLQLSGEAIIHRLFHEEDVRLFEAEPVSFRCGCSRERVAQAIRGLGRSEAESILAEQGTISADCEFCNRHYAFDPVDVEALFVASPVSSPSSGNH
ncbi:MAG: Hsp33 family molecular chaperone HslO [Gammaproteobacteria bacterium]|nr:Hsp33 family molecular chaperone HslO [Gammaproteobacteria bacterium]MCP5136234.1 Hsp33 family molecular chaperone HslO [Gammaproteobacteria bacterium]